MCYEPVSMFMVFCFIFCLLYIKQVPRAILMRKKLLKVSLKNSSGKTLTIKQHFFQAVRKIQFLELRSSEFEEILTQITVKVFGLS